MNDNDIKREDFIDVAKAIGIISVLYVHAGGVNGRQLIAPYYIQMFFMLSGYVFYQRASVAKALSNAKKMCLSYLKYAYLVYFLYLPLGIMSRMHPSFFFTNFIGVLYGRTALLYPLELENNIRFMQIGDGPLWFVACLSIVWLLISIYLGYATSVLKKYIYLMLLLLLSVLCKRIPILLPWGMDVAPIMTILLVVGMYLKKSQYIPNICWAFCYLLYIVFSFLFDFDINISTRWYGAQNSVLLIVLIGILGTLGCLFLSRMIVTSSFLLISYIKRLLLIIGRNTLPILAVHSLIYKYIDFISGRVVRNLEKINITFVSDFILVLKIGAGIFITIGIVQLLGLLRGKTIY